MQNYLKYHFSFEYKKIMQNACATKKCNLSAIIISWAISTIKTLSCQKGEQKEERLLSHVVLHFSRYRN